MTYNEKHFGSDVCYPDVKTGEYPKVAPAKLVGEESRTRQFVARLIRSASPKKS